MVKYREQWVNEGVNFSYFFELIDCFDLKSLKFTQSPLKNAFLIILV